MPTVMLGTNNALMDQNFARLAAACDAKLAAGTPVQHAPQPGYTATLGLAYQGDASLNLNWDAFDAAIATGTPPKAAIRTTAIEVWNINFRRCINTLIAAGIAIPGTFDTVEPQGEAPKEAAPKDAPKAEPHTHTTAHHK